MLPASSATAELPRHSADTVSREERPLLPRQESQVRTAAMTPSQTATLTHGGVSSSPAHTRMTRAPGVAWVGDEQPAVRSAARAKPARGYRRFAASCGVPPAMPRAACYFATHEVDPRSSQDRSAVRLVGGHPRRQAQLGRSSSSSTRSRGRTTSTTGTGGSTSAGLRAPVSRARTRGFALVDSAPSERAEPAQAGPSSIAIASSMSTHFRRTASSSWVRYFARTKRRTGSTRSGTG